MKRLFYYIFTYFLPFQLLVLPGCGRESVTNANLNIIGGVPVNSDRLDNVVALMRDELTVCTGTLIEPDLILTAAHCVEKAKKIGNSALSQLRVVVGNSTSAGANRESSQIVDAAVHPRFWQDHRGAMDFAWIRISPPITRIKPAILPLNRSENDGRIAGSKTVLIAGFGLSTMKPPAPGEAPQMGIKRQGESPIQFRTGVEFFAGNSKIDSCTGDSGGPAFMTTERSAANPMGLVLVGVTSRGPMPCASDYEAGAYGLVSEAVCWLRSSALYKLNDPGLRDFCVREAAQGATADNDAVVMKKNLVDACMDPLLSEASRQDLIQIFRATNTGPAKSPESCRQLQNVLSKIKSLDLSGVHLRQLAWLRHAEQLETLEVSDNLLLTTRGIDDLRHLKELDIRNNAITDMRELTRLSERMKVFGLRTQMSNLNDTTYKEIAELGAAAGSDKRTLIIALRDILVGGEIERKSLDLALKRQLSLDERGLRSLAALRGLENLETLSIVGNPDIKDWSELLEIPRLKLLRYAPSDNIPADIVSALKLRGTRLMTVP